MDLPSSGWYPDPYGTPGLLRWWDGSGWTHHTHPDVTAGGDGTGGAPAATAVQAAAVSGAALEATAVAGTAVQDAVQPTAFQSSVQSTALQATTVQGAAGMSPAGQAFAGQPSAEWLSQTKPPTGPPTQPQPALPPGLGAAATVYQAAPTMQAGGYQPTTVQPGYPQPGAGWGPAGGADGAGTQVMSFGGESWPGPGIPGGPGMPGMPGMPGGPNTLAGPGGPMSGNPYGYQEAMRQRRHRMVIGGVTAGAVVAVAAIALIVSSLGGSPAAPAADQSPAAASSTAAASVAAAVPSATASPSPTASPTMAMSGSLVTDSQSGLSYSQLPAPWQATASCPLSNQVFPWSDGESAAAGAGQVNGTAGPVTWYGEACSGVLPQQYGYTGTADLQNAAQGLAQTFGNAYYNALDHTLTPGPDTPVQVSGHAAWEVTFTVAYTNAAAQGATWTDEQAAVVVVDNGTPTPAVFFASVPSSLNESYVSTLVTSLQAAASPAATQSTDGWQGGGGSNP